MTEFEIRQAAFRKLKPRYKWIVRLLAYFLVVGPFLIIIGVNAGLALFFVGDFDLPVWNQTVGQVWSILFLAQVVLFVPISALKGRALLAQLFGRRLGWSQQQIYEIGSGRSYPEGWSN